MATSTQSVAADKLVSATVKYTNKGDAARVYDISANVRIQNGKVTNFESGEVQKIQNENTSADMPMEHATFNSYGSNSLHLDINDGDETEAQNILTAIYAFMAEVKAHVNSNPVTA